MSTIFDGSFETGSPSPWSPWNKPQAANYGQQTTPHALFGNLTFVTDVVGMGRRAARIDLPANPAGDHSHYTRAQVINANRPIVLGSDDWFTMMFLFPKGFTTGTTQFSGCQVFESWQTFSPPTIAVTAQNDHVTFTMKSGGPTAQGWPFGKYNSNADRPGGTPPGVTRLPDLFMVPKALYVQGVWHQYIIHRHVAKDTTGLVEGWFKVKGQTSWVQTFHLSGYPTIQTAADGSFGTFFESQQAYRAPSTTPLTIWIDGFSRQPSLAAAKVFLG